MNIHCSPNLLPTKQRETKHRVIQTGGSHPPHPTPIDQKLLRLTFQCYILGELLENKVLVC